MLSDFNLISLKEAVYAMHTKESLIKVKKYLKILKVGELLPNDVNDLIEKEEFKVNFFSSNLFDSIFVFKFLTINI